MSIFIAVDRFGSSRRIFRLRGVSPVLGLSREGILTSNTPAQPWVSFLTVGSTHYMHVESLGLSLNNSPLEQYSLHRVENGAILKVRDFTFSIFSSSPTAESLANSSRASMPTVKIRSTLYGEIAGVRYSLALPDYGEYSIGSSDEASLRLELPGVEPQHLIIRVSEGRYECLPQDGLIAIAGEVIYESRLILSGQSITLLPLGLRLRLDSALYSSAISAANEKSVENIATSSVPAAIARN